MLINDLKTNIVNKIGLSSAEAPLALTWLTKGYRNLLNKTHFYVSTTDISISPGVDEYQLSVAIDAIEDVTITGSLVKPERVSREYLLDLRRYANSGTTPGDVYAYALHGNLLMVYPMPTANATMHVYHIAAPTTSDFVGTEDCVSDLHMLPLGPLADALEYFALKEASEYDDKTVAENALQFMQLFKDSVTEAKKAVRKRAGRTLLPAQVGYPVRRGFPHRNDVYPFISGISGG